MKPNPLLAFLALSLSPLLLLPASGYAGDAEETELAAQIRQCDSCHGIDASIHSVAPILNGLPRRYLEEQLQNFVSGKRDNSDTEQVGQMIEQLQALPQPTTDRLARHYARLDPVVSAVTVAGDAASGEPLFEQHCAGCHSSSMGRLFTKSPPIEQLNGPYLLAQLQAFASGQRRFAETGKHKEKMVEVAKRFDRQQLLDITAYIKTVSPDAKES